MFLCIESSTSVCSVVLSDGSSLISMREATDGFRHAEKLTVFISEVLEEAGVSVSQLSAVAVSSGPGSYTGLRIGTSAAKGLCLAGDIPLIAIPTLEALAWGVAEIKNEFDTLLCPMIDARRMEVYCGLYDKNKTCVEPVAPIVVTDDLFINVRQAKKIFYFGDGAEKCKPVLEGIPEFIFVPGILSSAKNMVQLVLRKFQSKEFENLSLFEPFYYKEFVPGKKN